MTVKKAIETPESHNNTAGKHQNGYTPNTQPKTKPPVTPKKEHPQNEK